jgi:hypothetical protein
MFFPRGGPHLAEVMRTIGRAPPQVECLNRVPQRALADVWGRDVSRIEHSSLKEADFLDNLGPLWGDLWNF